MSIIKALNEARSYGRDSWDSNMPGYQGDYGGAENFGRRKRDWDENDAIDARLRQQHAQKQEYEKSGKFWLKLKDTQRHLPAGPFTGKQAANTAAIELLKQQPELKGNLVITAYGPDETQGVAEGQLDELSPQTLASYKKKAGADASAADKAGDYKRGNKRFSGIIKATKKEFDHDAKGVKEEISLEEVFDMKIDELTINEDWQKVNKKDKTDGMSRKAVKAYRRENPGSKLKTAVTTKPSKLKKGSKAAKRRKSFCARMSGMKKAHASAKTKRDPDSPINKALRRWNCESVEQMQELIMIAESKIAEAKNAKQQAAIAIDMKKAGKKPKNVNESNIMKGITK